METPEAMARGLHCLFQIHETMSAIVALAANLEQDRVSQKPQLAAIPFI